MAMMVSLERRIQTGAENRERQFFTHALRYLTTYSGRQVEVEDWMITSYEVEFKCKIGSGGLYVISRAHSVLAYRVLLSAAKSSKAVGTRRMWRSRCW
jgi:hypothetical protein